MKRAFTLVELVIVVAMVSVLVCVLLPMAAHSRGADQNAASQSNLRLLGSAGSSFASNTGGEVFTFNPNVNFGKIEVIGIISRLTGREVDSGEPDSLVRLDTIMPHRRYQHLVLLDFLGASANSEIAASPFDRNLINWQADPVGAQSTTVPYANGVGAAGSDSSLNWPNDDIRQMWPYASTYQTVPAAWNPDNNTGLQESWRPVSDTPHVFVSSGSGSTVGQQRYYPEVVFPSGKVHLFEEFDRWRWRDHLWFAYPEAKCNLLFFDGSVRRLRSGDANPGWSPNTPNTVWKQRYMPLDTFPWYAIDYKYRDEFFMKYRWTREGLAGIDYGGREPNRPPLANPRLNPEPSDRTNTRDVKETGAFPIEDG